jgi:hypothetical protein
MFMFDVLTANGANTGNARCNTPTYKLPNITNSFFPKNVKQDFLVEIRLHVKHYESCDVLCTF